MCIYLQIQGKNAVKFKVHESIVMGNYSTTLFMKHSVSTKYKAFVSYSFGYWASAAILCFVPFSSSESLLFAQLPLEGNASVFCDQEILANQSRTGKTVQNCKIK